ncbi:hypothetical protein COV15_01555 [Candidatus Woesearchaeota archaeon CG10_big_fil_rev_8_21_14_0_10_34_12]|nr:MAG: hypothetical protein COV15_01555 [Candidatus Woesearchaeota archaeon CG10_big_fil_rev_8_21_14_0_10_34_12]
MRLKDKLSELSRTYNEMEKEARSILKKIKPKVKSITDAQIVHSLTEKKDFYWKHDLSKLKMLAEKYQISLSKLKKVLEKYAGIDKSLLKFVPELEKLGLKDISFGPRTLLIASGNKKSNMVIYPRKSQLNIKVYPEFNEEENWTKDFEKFAEELKNKIKILTEKEI